MLQKAVGTFVGTVLQNDGLHRVMLLLVEIR